MRTRNSLLNSVTSLLLEIITIVCGFILPPLIIRTFGSKYNGITSSITQFLSYVSLLKSGIGGVTRASLYKPLHERDTNGISAIVMATEKFMRQIAMIFAVFLLIFALIYPFAISREFPWQFSSSLVLILGIGSFFQYYFGFTYQMLLQADQRLYISSLVQIFTTMANTLVAVLLIKIGCSIHIVKLGSAVVFSLNPLFLNIYVRRKYKINRSVPPNTSAISQRWDSFAHQISNFVHGNTDVVILTLFSSLSEVSVYTVYAMVVTGVRKLVYTLASGMEAAFGNMLAKKENELLRRNMELLEFIIFYAAGFFFSCTIVMIVPFVHVYTSGIQDVNYIRPIFGILLCIAELLWCIRIPYQSVVLAAGRFKETRNGAIAEPIINIVISVCLVFRFGMIGVAVGTIAAMAFRTVQYAVYMSRFVVIRPISIFVKKVLIIAANISLSCVLSSLLNSPCESYLQWFFLALIRAGSILAVHCAFVLAFERQNFALLMKKLASLGHHKKTT